MPDPKFTQGPWEVNTTEDELWGDDVWYLTEHYSVNSKDETIVDEVYGKENACLIASAPELYAMLEEILQSGKLSLGMYTKVKKVMQKARGEA